MKFRHTGVLVYDLERSIKFYTDLGFKVVNRKSLKGKFIETLLGAPELELTYVKFCLPPDEAPIFELHHWDNTDLVYGLKNRYQAHIALTYEGNLKNFYLKNHSKIKFVSEPKRDPSTKTIVCFIEDPDGNMVELVEGEKNAKSNL